MPHLRSTLLATTMLALLAGPAIADTTSAGVTAAVNPQATGTEPAGPTKILEVGTNLVMDEKIQTGPEGQTQLLFRDGSTMTIGPSTLMTIDTFVYDPNQRTGKLAMTVTSGIIRFVGGRASKGEDGVAIKTPVAALVIRGGIADVEHNPATGTTTGQFLFGRQMSFSSGSDSRTLTTPGFGISVGPNGQVSQPFAITSQGLAQTNRSIEGKGRNAAPGGTGASGNGPPTATASAAGAGSASASLDDSARIVSAANSGAPPAPPPPPPIVQVAAPQAQTETQTVIATLTNQQSSGVLNTTSNGGLGTTATPQLTSGTYNGAGVLPQSDSNALEVGNATTYPTYSYTQPNPAGQGTITVTDSETLSLQFSNNQLQSASNPHSSIQSGATIGTYTDNSTGQKDFVGTNLGNIVVDNSIFLGVLTGGTITDQGSGTNPGGQSGSNSSSYTLLPTDQLPVLFGRPINPSLLPSSGLYTYNLTASTPVYLLNSQSSPGQLTASVLTVYFGGSASSAQNNIAAAWTGQVSVGGHIYQISTTASGTAASLSQALSSGSSAALTGSTARGDLSGVFKLVSTNGGTFCTKGCQGAAAGFFAGSAGKQIGLAYQAPGTTSQSGLPAGTLNLVGAASFTRP